MDLKLISQIIGYIYILCWSFCYYCQFYTIYKLKSAEGFSLDFQLLNIIGFSCLTISYVYNYLYLNNSLIMLNDVIFAISCFITTMIILCQSFFYPLVKNKLSKTGLVGSLSSVSFIFIYMIFSIIFTNQITVFEYIGTTKIIVSCFKYIVQIGFNYRRKLTIGWSTSNTILDLMGAILSIIQLLIDYYRDNNQENPLKGSKFLLGMVTIFFEIILILQIFIFYRKNNKNELRKILLNFN